MEVTAQSYHGYQEWGHGDIGGIVDAQRILSQNNSEGRARWGIGQKEYILKLKNTMDFHPRKMAELGVGPDATLVLNALDIFGDSLNEFVIFELDEGRLRAAKQTIEAALQNDERFRGKHMPALRYVQGDAGKTIQGEGNFDFIHAQLLFEHLFPKERKDLLKGVRKALNTGGLFTIADVLFDSWTVDERQDLQEEQRAKATRIARRDNRMIQILREEEWKNLKKKDFADISDIVDMVANEGGTNKKSSLTYLPDMAEVVHVPSFRKEEDEWSLMQAMIGRLRRSLRVQRAVTLYSGDLTKNIAMISPNYPDLARVTFRKTA